MWNTNRGGKFNIGFNQTGIFDAHYQRAILNISGKLELNGSLYMGAGSRIEIDSCGVLIVNGLVSNSAGLTLCCHDFIEIGANTVISWDTLIMDKDFHYVLNTESGQTKTDHKPILIGNGCWLCAGSKVLKGAVIPDGCILSAGSVASNQFQESNCLLMGIPSKVVKRNVRRSDKELKKIISDNA